MVSANDIKMDIINLVSQISDLDKLKLIYKKVEQVDKALGHLGSKGGKPAFRDGVVEIRKGVDYEQILQEQGYQPVSYNELRELANQIEWEHSLEELLEALD